MLKPVTGKVKRYGPIREPISLAAIREVREETGLWAMHLRVLGKYTAATPNGMEAYHVVHVPEPYGQIQIGEPHILGAEWYGPDMLEELVEQNTSGNRVTPYVMAYTIFKNNQN